MLVFVTISSVDLDSYGSDFSDCRLHKTPEKALAYVYSKLRELQQHYPQMVITAYDERGSVLHIDDVGIHLESWSPIEIKLQSPRAPCALTRFRVIPRLV